MEQLQLVVIIYNNTAQSFSKMSINYSQKLTDVILSNVQLTAGRGKEYMSHVGHGCWRSP